MQTPIHPIVARFHASSPAMPKHLRLRQSIVESLESGDLPIGTKLTGERELSEQLGLSLGTTQKALGRLVTEGFLVRRHGLGTFVGSVQRPMAGPWHFRFVSPQGGAELPVFATIIERALVTDEGPWTAALGSDAKGYVLIRRSVDIGGMFRCASRMLLPATRFGRLLRISERQLAHRNLKELMADEFAAPTVRSEGLAQCAALDRDDARVIGVAARTMGMRLQITSFTLGRVPITYQQVCIPPTDYLLKLDFNPPADAPTDA